MNAKASIRATLAKEHNKPNVRKACSSYINATCGHVSPMTHFQMFNRLLQTINPTHIHRDEVLMRKLITRIAANSFLIADQERKGERDRGLD